MIRRALRAVVLAALAAACGRGGAPSVGRVQLSSGAQEQALRAAGVERAALDELARSSLRSAGFRLSDGRAAYRARVEVIAAQRAPGDGDALEIAVEVQLFAPDADRSLAEEGVGRAPAERGAAAWREAFAAAVRDAAAGLRVAIAAEGRPTAQLVADLGAQDARSRAQAVRVLGDRRAREAVPALVALLRDPDLDLAERSAGALAQIGDPRAVAPIIDFTQRLDDGPYSPRYVRLIGDIGGSEARAYLLTVESGHTDPRIREAAREARERLDAREHEASRPAAGATRSASRDSGRMER